VKENRGQTRHVFLMCPPEYFTVAYIINPWMHGNLRRIDNAVAKQQWRALYDTITDHAVVLPSAGKWEPGPKTLLVIRLFTSTSSTEARL